MSQELNLVGLKSIQKHGGELGGGSKQITQSRYHLTKHFISVKYFIFVFFPLSLTHTHMHTHSALGHNVKCQFYYGS